MQIRLSPSLALHRNAVSAADPGRIPGTYTRSRDADAAVSVPANAVDGHPWRSRTSNQVQEAVQAGGWKGDVSQIDFMLKGDPQAVKACSRFQHNTLLHDACKHWASHPDQDDLIHVLAKHGVDVNATNILGETALDMAAKRLGPGLSRTAQAHAIEVLLRCNARITPAVMRRSEELASKGGDPWLREVIANRARTGVRP